MANQDLHIAIVGAGVYSPSLPLPLFPRLEGGKILLMLDIYLPRHGRAGLRSCSGEEGIQAY
jgi:hypothetical protein